MPRGMRYLTLFERALRPKPHLQVEMTLDEMSRSTVEECILALNMRVVAFPDSGDASNSPLL